MSQSSPPHLIVSRRDSVQASYPSHGYKYHRTAASHDQWVKKGARTIPVWGDEKEIPAMHLKVSCRTIGCTMEELYEWASNNC